LKSNPAKPLPRTISKALNTGLKFLRHPVKKLTFIHTSSFDPIYSRNHDLILSGLSDDKKVLVSVEAKADEPFGELICNVGSNNPNSKIPQRLELLKNSIFGRTTDDMIGNVRYQLLTGVAGALIEAKNWGAGISVFIVHEFVSKALDYKKVKLNSNDFKYFVRILSEKPDLAIQPDELIEIGIVRGGEFVPSDIKLFIGKIQTRMI